MYIPILLIALDASVVLGAKVIHMPFQKFHTPHYGMAKRSGDFSVPLTNKEVSYQANVQVGTPPQQLAIVVDTGSSDVWMTSSQAQFCQSSAHQKYYCSGGTFNQGQSSTYNNLNQVFQITYEDKTGSKGYYFTDTFSINGQSITKQQMGLALETTIGTGIMGVGFQSDESVCTQTSYAGGGSGGGSGGSGGGTGGSGSSAYPGYQSSPASLPTGGAQNKDFERAEILAIEAGGSGSGGSSSLGCHTYPSVVSQMVSQGLIKTQAYSLWLDDLKANSGAILFGGIDSSKFQGSLSLLSIQRDSQSRGYTSFSVTLANVTLTSAGKTYNFPTSSLSTNAILDSGTSLTILPDDIANAIFNLVGVQSQQGSYIAKCSEANVQGSFNFQFGDSSGPIIQVPISEMFIPLSDFGYSSSTTAGGSCIFGIEPAKGRPILLGDTFLRSAYVVYDLDNKQIGLAQTNFNPSGSNVQEIQAGSNGIPNVSGAPNSVAPTITPTSGQVSQTPAGQATAGSLNPSGSITVVGSGAFSNPPTQSPSASAKPNAANQFGGWTGSAAVGAVVAFAALGSAMLLM